MSGAAVKTEAGYVKMKVQMQNKRDHEFTIRRDEAIRPALVGYCRLEGLDFATIRFLHDGKRVQADDTPDKFEMEEDDTIDAFEDMVGGSASPLSDRPAGSEGVFGDGVHPFGKCQFVRLPI